MHTKCTDKLHYGAVKELFQFLGVNPWEFYDISDKDKVCGYFPNIQNREMKVSVYKLSQVLNVKEES